MSRSSAMADAAKKFPFPFRKILDLSVAGIFHPFTGIGSLALWRAICSRPRDFLCGAHPTDFTFHAHYIRYILTTSIF